MRAFHSAAFSLIETLLALVMLATGLLTIVALLPAGIRFPYEATAAEAEARAIRWSVSEFDQLEAGGDTVRYFDAQGWPVIEEDGEPALEARFSRQAGVEPNTNQIVIELRSVGSRRAEATPARVYYLQTAPP